VGSGDPHELVAATAAAIATTRTNVRTILILILSAAAGCASSLEPGRRRPWIQRAHLVDEGGQRCGARIVVVTHEATDAALSDTVAALADLDVVQEVASVLRLEGTSE
jgi:hypothetical protein